MAFPHLSTHPCLWPLSSSSITVCCPKLSYSSKCLCLDSLAFPYANNYLVRYLHNASCPGEATTSGFVSLLPQNWLLSISACAPAPKTAFCASAPVLASWHSCWPPLPPLLEAMPCWEIPMPPHLTAVQESTQKNSWWCNSREKSAHILWVKECGAPGWQNQEEWGRHMLVLPTHSWGKGFNCRPPPF